MEYQKIINLFDKETSQLSKFRTENWVEVNGKVHELYNTNSQIKFKTKMFKSSLCYYTDGYILLKGTLKSCEKRSKC